MSNSLVISIDKLDNIKKQLNEYACKIIISKDNFGTGFMCSIPHPGTSHLLSALITNNHVLDGEKININKIITISFNINKEKIKIKIDPSRINYTNPQLDITIIEIKPEDKIDNFLEIDDIRNEKDYNEEEIYILQYAKSICSYACGLLINITDGKIKHKCGGNFGSSGGTIIFLKNYKVIGVHKGKTIHGFREGIFIKNIVQDFNNKIKTKRYNNGDYYIGELLNEKREGKGRYIYENGNYYEGEWSNDLKHGKGILYYKDDSIKYEGHFVTDKFSKIGKYIYEDGDYYLGYWSNDLKNGKGFLCRKDGKLKYEGYFMNNKYEGYGKEYYRNGKRIKYEGDFKDGKYEGIGKLIYQNRNY